MGGFGAQAGPACKALTLQEAPEKDSTVHTGILGDRGKLRTPGRLKQQGRWEGGRRAEGQGQEDRLASVTCVASVRRPYRHPLTVNPLAGVQGRQGER